MNKGFNFREINAGIEIVGSSFSLPRHRHLQAYATVILSGTFVEAGNIGRIQGNAGDVLIHPVLDSHANCRVSAGITLLRLAWSDASGYGGLYRIADVDLVARTAENDFTEAALLLREMLEQKQMKSPGAGNDWPDELAEALSQGTPPGIREWAHSRGLAAETVSRGFKVAYGTSPNTFRAEVRTRKAWLKITRGSSPLSQIAAEAGFADQAHMTRWIRHVTGASPNAWRQRARR